MTVIKHLCLSSALLFLTTEASASDRNILPLTTLANECERILSQQLPTLAQLTQAAQKEQHILREKLPARTFIDPLVDQARVEPFDAFGPKALMDLNPPQMAFQAAQAPFPEGPAVIRMDSPDKSIVLRKYTRFNGQTIGTTVYASLPLRVKANERSKSPLKRPFLVGPEYKDTGVIFWLHGGGTPTAMGVNAMSVGLELGKRKVPVIAIDLPGHGNSSIYPFKSGQEKIEYLIATMRDLIHPDVPIIPGGHSLGGQLVIQMRLLWNKLNTKNLNVAGFLSLAPPADMSLGGCSAERDAADKAVERDYKNYKDRIAPSDFDFIENIVRKGKTAPVAGIMCSISAVDYSWRLPEAGAPAAPRLMVIVGENDGLVYTGREAAFKTFLTQLVGPENLLILPPGRTFKGDNIPTGHNVFDRFLDAAGREELREFLADEADKKDIAEVYLRIAHFVAKQTGNNLAKMGAEEEEADTSLNGLIDRTYRQYSYNLAFRQFVKTYVYRDFLATPKAVALREKRLVLDKYLKAVGEARLVASKTGKGQLQETLNQLAKTWNMKSAVVARKELPIIRTEARAQELRKFVDEALPIKQKILTESPDTTAEEIRKLESRPSNIETLEQALNEQAKPGIDKKRYRELDTFILNARTIVNRHQKQIGSKISLEIDAKLKIPEGVKSISDAQWELELDISEERKRHIIAYLAEVDKIEKMHANPTDDAVKSIPLPEGVTNFEVAEKEAKKIRSIELARYIPESDDPSFSKSTRNAASLIKRMEDTAVSVNQTQSQIKEAVSLITVLKKKRIDERKKMDEAFKNAVPPKLVDLIFAREEAQEALEEANSKILTTLDGQDPVLKQLLTDRADAFKRFEEAKQHAQIASQGIHPEVLLLLTIREKALLNNIRANRNYDIFVSTNVTTAYDRGDLTNEHVQRLFADVHSLAESYKHARGHFLKASHRLDEVVLRLAQEGQLGSETEMIVNQLLGKEGIEYQLQQAIQHRDELFNILASLQTEQTALRKKYNEIVPGFYEYREQDLSSLLNLSYDDLIQRLTDHATGPLTTETLRSALKEFDDMWRGRDAPEKKGVEIN